MHNKYSFWKSLGLIVLVVVAFIYAIPNLYGSAPRTLNHPGVDGAKLEATV